MENSYYDTDKHQYMQHRSYLFAEYVYSLISDASFSSYDTAIELGAGMGRFSPSVVMNFSNVTLIEPANSYASLLRDTFSKKNVRVVNIKAEDFLEDYNTDKPVIVFCFHLMHHLKREQREAIYQFVKRTGSKCVLVEPNPFNPLILLQILLHPDMSIGEEIQYLTLTPRKFRQEVENNGLVLSSFSRFCFFPPFATDFLLKTFPRSAVIFFEAFNKVFPFMSSYQLITCEVPE
jgi:hypothetical protein